ncbi:B3/B4 domain-containing protein [Alkalicoccobacillus porphyridii]|uniref:B3/B4 tRNA-binding domain-containing protein n=1 Tax=Alkalicoccobacillus porphyridii TaxID=2597270 RepID=A0A553ZU15_9BACI|nr:phenylalanine--tRNA ligase beta subunit-related protein [Alkalicoccobacillus porphyridii]TSB44806.1 hypothetical protein FN960_19575 [Alkalicoccobacillus porphyridii]
MLDATIDSSLHTLKPNLSIGLISYYHISIGTSPQMIQGRFRYFQEVLSFELQEKEFTDYEGIQVWRDTFKQLGISASRYRPSHEAIYRRIKKGAFLDSANSAIDLNNLFSIEYQIPIGLYDTAHIEGPIQFKMGEASESYEALNGRHFSAEGKLVSVDQQDAFGSPIVDSTRTAVNEQTTNAVQILYLNPTQQAQESQKLLERASQMFTQVHGGEAEVKIIPDFSQKV